MQYTLWALFSLPFAAASLLGQTQVKLRPAQTSPASVMTDQEKNFRAYITAARFLQVENQIERILDLQISSQLPVIEESQRRQP